MPRLLIVRHAIAQDRDEAYAQHRSDADRPLTDKGRRRMQQVAAGIHCEAGQLEQILSSPLLRAHQTAEILSRQYPETPLTITDSLSPGQSLPSLVEELAATSHGGTVAIVGHEPDLSSLIALLVFRNEQAAIQLKKGGAALLDFPHRIAIGNGALLWLLTPGQLRKLGSNNR